MICKRNPSCVMHFDCAQPELISDHVPQVDLGTIPCCEHSLGRSIHIVKALQLDTLTDKHFHCYTSENHLLTLTLSPKLNHYCSIPNITPYSDLRLILI